MISMRLKKLRKEKKLTQDDMASKLGVERTTYANWETDRAEPSIEMLIMLSEFFNVSIDYLCGKSNIRYSLENKTPLECSDIAIDMIEIIKKHLERNK